MDFCAEHNGPYITSQRPRIHAINKGSRSSAIKGDGSAPNGNSISIIPGAEGTLLKPPIGNRETA